MNIKNQSMHCCMLNKSGTSIWLLAILLMVSGQLFANDINLESAIKLMSERNPSLKVFEIRKRILGGAKITAELNPELEAGIEVENFAGTNPYSTFRQSELTVALSSVIELGGKKESRNNLVLKQHELLDAQRKVHSLNLISGLTELFIETLATQERIKLAHESVQLNEDIFKSVKRKANAGAISDVEVKRSFAALKQSQITLKTEQLKLDRQRVNLSLLWADKTPSFDQLSGSLFNFGHIKDLDRVMSNLEQSSLITVLVANQRMAESQLQIAQAESKADISWSLGIRRIEESNDNALTAGFSLPLFKKKRNEGALIEAEAEIEALKTKQNIALLELFGQVNELYSLRTSALERYSVLEGEVIPALSEALSLTKAAYLDGRYGYLEYSAARSELIQSKKALIDTAEIILKYGVQLERITAESVYVDQLNNPGAGS